MLMKIQGSSLAWPIVPILFCFHIEDPINYTSFGPPPKPKFVLYNMFMSESECKAKKSILFSKSFAFQLFLKTSSSPYQKSIQCMFGKWMNKQMYG